MEQSDEESSSSSSSSASEQAQLASEAVEAQPSQPKKARRAGKKDRTPITEAFDDSRTLFAGRLPFRASSEDIAQLFGEVGAVSRVRLLQYKGKSNGAAFIEFATPADARAGLRMHGESFMGRTIHVNMVEDHQNTTKAYSVYVGNLAFTTTEKTLRSVFENCGAVLRVKLPLFKDTGRLRGFAIIDLDNEKARERAVQLDGITIDGREVRVQEMEKEAKGARKPKGLAYKLMERNKRKVQKNNTKAGASSSTKGAANDEGNEGDRRKKKEGKKRERRE